MNIRALGGCVVPAGEEREVCGRYSTHMAQANKAAFLWLTNGPICGLLNVVQTGSQGVSKACERLAVAAELAASRTRHLVLTPVLLLTCVRPWMRD